MNSLLIVGSYIPSIINFRGELIKDILGSGWRVFVAAPNPDEYPEEIKKIQSLGAVYCEIPMNRVGSNPLQDLKTLFAIRDVIRQNNITNMLAYTIKPVIFGMLATIFLPIFNKTALITGLGFSFSSSGSIKQKSVQFIARSLYRLSLSFSTKVIFQNPDDRDLFVRHGFISHGKTALVNGSGVCLEAYKYSAPVKRPVKRFLMIARLIKEKGVYEFVEAAKKIKDHYSDVEFHVVGWIDENPTAITQQELEGWVKQGLIIFHGKLIDVRPVIDSCDVFVLPSFYPEGTPRTILEAMAIGRPIITTNTPGCKETVVEGINGYLVKPRDVKSLVLAVTKFLNEPNKIHSMGKESRIIAENKYCVDKVNNEMLKLMNVGP